MALPQHDPPLQLSESGDSTNQHSQERLPIVRSRANITSACLACKRRKRKCLGGSPCPHCSSLKIQCLYDERLDKRRKAFNERARAEIDFQRRLLDGLLKAIKSEHAPIILDMVRSNASLDEIASRLEHLDMLHEIRPGSSPQIHISRGIPETPDYLRDRFSNGGSESQVEDLTLNTTTAPNAHILHPLNISQLLAPRLNNSDNNYPMSQLNTAPNSIPSLSEVLLDAQRYRDISDSASSQYSPPLPYTQQKQTCLSSSPAHCPPRHEVCAEPNFVPRTGVYPHYTTGRRSMSANELDQLLNKPSR